MKLLIKTIHILFLLTLFGNLGYTQDCGQPTAQKVLHSKNLSVNILNGGDLFWDLNNAYFHTNPDNPNPTSSIFNTGFWMGGFTGFPSNPNLKMAAATYNNGNSYDYFAGPLSEIGTTTADNCSNFDKLWEVFGTEIKQHIDDFQDDGFVANKKENIYGYPGHQNPFFEDLNGFPLPNTPQGLAPFWDNNNDGIYNPDDGDYPLPTAVHKEHYPSHMIWGVFNDAGGNHTTTQGDGIRAEIQLTAWAFSCTDNSVLNNSIFTSHKIINRSQEALDSTYVGTFVDFDLGCYTDDYVGSIPEMNTFYAYNSDGIDGDRDGICQLSIPTYGTNPPVQSVTYLNHTMNTFSTTTPANSPDGLNWVPAGYYNLISGSWADGLPFTNEGNGYNSGQPTSYLFPNNPNDSNGWSMTTEAIPDGDFRTISGIYLDEMVSGAIETIDMVYTFYQDETKNNLETVDLVYQFTPELQQMYDSNFEMACDDLYLPTDDLQLSKFDIYPNPTTDILNIKMENPTKAIFYIFDIYGKRVLEKSGVLEQETQLSTSTLSQGIYFLKIKTEGQEFVKKFIKI